MIDKNDNHINNEKVLRKEELKKRKKLIIFHFSLRGTNTKSQHNVI